MYNTIMTETVTPNPQKLWESLSEIEQEAVMSFGVSDRRTGVGKDYVDAMGISGQQLEDLIAKGLLETKPTWKMFQDEAEKLAPQVSAIRERMKDYTYKLETEERQTLSTYENFTSVASRKSEEPRYHLADPKFHEFVGNLE